MDEQVIWAGTLLDHPLFGRRFDAQEASDAPSATRVLWICLGIALSSRILFLLFYIIGRNIPHVPAVPGEDHHLALYTLDNLRAAFDSAISYGDFDWYSKLAANGYTRVPFSNVQQRNWAFFPLQSLLILAIHSSAVRFVFGLTTFFAGIGFFVSYSLKYMRRNAVILSCAFVCFSPYAGSLSQFRPDSLLFASLCGMMYFARMRWLIACLILLIVAGLSKPNGFLGVILVAPYFVEGARDRAEFIRKNWLRLGLIGLAGIAGLIAMSVMGYLFTGNSMAWSQIQAAWGNRFFVRPAVQFAKLILDPQIIGRSGWDFELFNWFVFVAALLSISTLIARKIFFLAAFAVLYVLITFVGFGDWTLMKHLAASPAMPIGLGLKATSLSASLALCILVVFATLFGLVAVAMGAGVGAAWI